MTEAAPAAAAAPATPAIGGGATPPATPAAPAAPAPASISDDHRKLINDNWRSAVDPEYASHTSTADYKSLNDLLKSHINAQKLIGVDKIAKPSDKWTPEQKREWSEQLGLPKDMKEYKLGKPQNAPEDFPYSPDDESFYRELFHKKMMLPAKDAETMWNEVMNRRLAQFNDMKTKNKLALDEGFNNLKRKYGDTLPSEIEHVNEIVRKYDKSGKVGSLLKTKGLDNNEHIIDFMIEVGKNFKEDSMPKKQTASGRISPQQAKAIADKMLDDKSHPINNPESAQHQSAYKEYLQLREIEFQGVKQ